MRVQGSPLSEGLNLITGDRGSVTDIVPSNNKHAHWNVAAPEYRVSSYLVFVSTHSRLVTLLHVTGNTLEVSGMPRVHISINNKWGDREY